ncbi:MAG TPA: FliH/SctL family protein [Bryobacteraceae bacterium]|nr:FliH/SctL family protein [Bryobacteraceae bacterium]
MSSKIMVPDEQRPPTPVPWRQVTAGSGTPPPAEEKVDVAAQIAQIEAQYQQKVREARAAGMREGEIAGKNRAASELQPVVERLTRAIQDIANLRARLRREAEADVVQLSLAIARRIIRRELSVDTDALHGLVMAALEKLQGQEISRVKVHPSHVSLVKSSLQQAVSGGAVEIIADASRELGSVVFETTRGNLDASVESQLQEIERGLADRLRKQS